MSLHKHLPTLHWQNLGHPIHYEIAVSIGASSNIHKRSQSFNSSVDLIAYYHKNLEGIILYISILGTIIMQVNPGSVKMKSNHESVALQTTPDDKSILDKFLNYVLMVCVCAQ